MNPTHTLLLLSVIFAYQHTYSDIRLAMFENGLKISPGKNSSNIKAKISLV